MPIQYSCFISYRHKNDDIAQHLVSSLETELNRWLDMEVYVDKDHLKGGDFFNNELAKALCESVCLIVVYTPNYFSKKETYCAREYRAMELLEKKRWDILGIPKNKKHSFIIPIVYRGYKKLPENIKNERQYYPFENYQLTGQDNLQNPEYAEIIKEIAEYIQERRDELSWVEHEVCKCCDEISFPLEDDVFFDWIEQMLPPKQKLPGREEIN
jgi:hypothetical protein